MSHLKQSPTIGIFFVFVLFYTHQHSIKLCSNTAILYLYVSKVVFAPLAQLEMRVAQIFLLFFPQFYSFVYRHSDLEGSCWIWT
jgi:hypothetical protein